MDTITKVLSVLKDKKKAQSAVELALIAPFLILFIMGALDLGKAFQIKIALNSAAQQGATYLAYNSSDAQEKQEQKCLIIFGITIYCWYQQAPNSEFSGAVTAIKNITDSTGIVISDKVGDNIFISCTPDASCPVGSQATVKINYSFSPILLHFLSGSINLSSSVSTMVLR